MKAGERPVPLQQHYSRRHRRKLPAVFARSGMTRHDMSSVDNLRFYRRDRTPYVALQLVI